MKKSLAAVHSSVHADFQSTWCEIPLKSCYRLLIGCVYRSPNSSPKNNEKLNKALQDITNDRSHVLITGDFNYPDLDWQSGVSLPDAENKDTRFMEAVMDAFLFQLVTDPRH